MLATTLSGGLVGVGALYAPGYCLARAGGCGRVVSLAAAPALSVGLIATLGVAYGGVGVAWNLASVGAGLGVIVAVAAAILLWRVRRGAWEYPRLGLAGLEVGVGGVAGAWFASRIYLAGTTGFHVLPQTFDAPFHLNAVDEILRTGDASSLHLGRMVNGGFYPAAWHDVVSLIALGGPEIITATHLTVCASFVALTLAQACVAHLLTGGLPGAALLAGLAPAAYLAFPYRLASYGTVWPNFFAYALIPAAVVLLAETLRRTRDGEEVGLGRWGLLALAALGIGLAQPNGTFAFVLIAVVGLCALTWRQWRAAGRAGGWDRLVAWSWPVVLVAGLAVMSRSALLRSVMNWSSRYPDPSRAGSDLMRDVLVDTQFVTAPGLGNTEAAPWLAVLALVGAVYVVWRRDWWFVVATCGFVAFYAGAMKGWPGADFLARAWYYDQVRIGALAPLLLAPLAGIGAASAVNLPLRALAWERFAWARRARAVAAVVLAPVLVVAAAPLTDDYRSEALRTQINRVYWWNGDPNVSYNSLLKGPEADFQRSFDRLLPKGATVVGSPYTGAVTIPALSDVSVVFPHFGGNWSADQRLLARRFRDIGVDPLICRVLHRHHIDYFYWDNQYFWRSSGLYRDYIGLTYTRFLDPYLTLVAERDGAALYKITGCPTKESHG